MLLRGIACRSGVGWELLRLMVLMVLMVLKVMPRKIEGFYGMFERRG